MRVLVAHGANTIPVQVHVVPLIRNGGTLEEKLTNSVGSISTIDPVAISVPVLVTVIV